MRYLKQMGESLITRAFERQAVDQHARVALLTTCFSQLGVP